MAHLSEAEMINWMALYSATALCCAIAIALAIVVLAIRLWREEVWTQLRGPKDVALFVPKTWWRWQKLYLLSTPVTLAIVCSFGLTLSWS
jgi:hypothetical protein